MSTTFGVRLPDNKIEPILHRVEIGSGKVGFVELNPLAFLLPVETKLIAMDNTAQGIETIGDVLGILKKQATPQIK